MTSPYHRLLPYCMTQPEMFSVQWQSECFCCTCTGLLLSIRCVENTVDNVHMSYDRDNADSFVVYDTPVNQ